MDGIGVAAHNDCPSSRSCGASMSAFKRHHLLPLGLTGSLALMALGVPGAQAHTHPTPIERAAPAVVFIEAREHVEVTLIEHDLVPDRHGIHVHVFEDTSEPLLDTASGFFVDPSGTVVTTGALLRQDLDKGEVWAINHTFADRYRQARLPADPAVRHHIGPRSDRIEQRLQACYPPHISLQDAGGCVVRRQMVYRVHPYVTDQRRYGNLPGEVDLEHSTADVALLRVRSNNLPTVTVAPPSPQETALAVLGFTAVPGTTGAHRQQVINQHFAKPGGPVFKSANLDAAEAEGSAMLKEQLGHGVEGGPVVAGGGKAASAGQVVGLIPGPAPAGQPVPRLVGAATILGVLRSAGVANRSSVTDQQFELAMHHFKNKEYSASIPYLENTLKQFPGQALAAADLAVARDQVKKGAGSPATSASAGVAVAAAHTSSSGWLVPTGIVVVVLAALLAVVVALRQRRRGHGGGDRAQPSAAGPPAPGADGRGVRTGAAQDRAPSHEGPSGVPAAGSTPSRTPASHGGARGDAQATPRAAASQTSAGGAAPSGVRARQELVRPSSSSTRSPGAQDSTPRPGPERGADRQSAVLRHNGPPDGGHPLTGSLPSAGSAPSEVPRFCTSCGGQLAAGHRFCGRCGTPVGQ
jgi:hypothetical protein